MFIIRTASDAVSQHSKVVAQAIESSVRLLLEQRHLYQSVEGIVEKSSEEYLKHVPTSLDHTKMHMKGVENWNWLVHDSDSFQAMAASLAKESDRKGVTWRIPDVKLFCKICDRVEPFNGVSATNMLNRQTPSSGGVFHKGKLIQVYCLSYLCQSCKAVPEVFLIRRIGTRLTQCGRAPLEHVPVPQPIPKAISKFYSDAVVAHQSGQTLAGLFLLRTACEQWTRQFADPADKADVALEKYMSQLPEDFKGRFPSLRTIYSDLSAAIHSANATAELFDSAAEQIEEHFAARSLFKLKP